jgi:FMN-dependent NADH-azoreductase
MTRVLTVQSSARTDGSVTRRLAEGVVARLRAAEPDVTVTTRDLAEGVSPVDSDWVDANFTPAEDRTPEQWAALAESERLVQELEAADVVVIGAPIYNFAVPAALKAWIDQVARAKRTFRYTETGPEGLLTGKTAYVAVASGGLPLGSDVDFATGYIRHVLGFLGITDVRFLDASAAMVRDDDPVASALAALDAELPNAA